MKAVTITMEPELLEEVNERVKGLDSDRSKYFRNLARKDMEMGILAPPMLPRSARLSVKRSGSHHKKAGAQ